MGCHTWFKKPLIKGKENIQHYLKKEIDTLRTKDWWDKNCEAEVPTRLEAIENISEDMDEDLKYYLGVNNSVTFVDGEPIIFVSYEDDNNEPRIGGYPEQIIKSADEMFKVMETGLTNSEGKHYHFRWEPEREDYIRNHIKTFFEKYPDGIIEFG